MMISTLSFALMSSFFGCDRNAKDLVPVPSDAHPGVIEGGELAIVTKEELNVLNGEPEANPIPYVVQDNCEEPEDGSPRRCFFGQLGQTPLGQSGGATFTFMGNGEEVCLVVDPETVFWAQSISPVKPTDEFVYPDYYDDDGDLDMFSGLSSYYTGSPGVELGDFKGFYTDSLGQEVEIEYGECFQTGAQTGMTDAHAGRATIEYCGIDTDQRVGIEYTVVLETVSVPMDDGVLSFGVAVLEGRCARLGPTECTIRGESLESIPTTADGKKCKDPSKDGCEFRPRYCTEELEKAQCQAQLRPFCCANPDMCGDNVPEDACKEEVYALGDDSHTRDEWCEATDLCCPGSTKGSDTGE